MKHYFLPNHIFFLIIIILACVTSPATGYARDLPSVGSEKVANFPVNDEDGALDASSFSSHLPLLVFEREGESEAVSLRVHDAPDGHNTIQDTPSAIYSVLLREEEAKSPTLQSATGKKSYTLEIPAGNDAPMDGVLMGVPGDSQWRLQGSTKDKGMLRNGLAYALGKRIFPSLTPAICFIEVLFKDERGYHYEGLYILAESPAHLFRNMRAGKDEGALFTYTPDLDRTREGSDQVDSDRLLLGWTLREKGFAPVYPEKSGAAQEARLQTALDSLDRTLHSLNPGTFLEYTSLLDQASVVDLYLINALLMNVHSTPVPFSLHLGTDGKLYALPVWNFDAALDNTRQRHAPLPFEVVMPNIDPPSVLARRVPVWRELENGGDISNLRIHPLYTAMDGDRFLWFDRLFLSKSFIDDLYARYHALKRGPLAPDNIGRLADSLAFSLGPALDRDWVRWHEEYTAAQGPYTLDPFVDDQEDIHIRGTNGYGQELVKMRYLLHEQDTFLTTQAARLDGMSADLFDTAANGNRKAAYALGTIIVFLFLTHILTKKL